MTHIVAIGAGQAGASLVAKLRNLGHEGKITLIGEEPHPPYQRPPLSKKYMLGEMDVERLYLRPKSFYEEQNIDLVTNIKVDRIEPDNKRLHLANGDSITYDKLALTTGSYPRLLPTEIGGDLDGVYPVRTLMDADSMAHQFQSGKTALIIGGGYIGLEAAAVAASRGVKVILVEMADRILQRVAAKETSDYFRNLHQSHGVDIREGIGLLRLNGDDTVKSATLTDGTEIQIDFAIVGVGITPATELAETAGLEIDNGIRTDHTGRTSNPDIYAAGDCASFPYRGHRIRLESVPNAIDQAEIAAAAMLGHDVTYTAKPWFWSDQYDVKLQIAGLNTGYDTIVARQSDGATSFWYYKGDTLLAVDAMNDPRGYMVGKRLIEAGKSPDPCKVADTAIAPKELLDC